MRGSRDQARIRDVEPSEPTAETPYPRIGGLGGPAGSDLLPKFAGLRLDPATVGRAFPAFTRTRYPWSTFSTTAEPKTRPVSLVANLRCGRLLRRTPASALTRYSAIAVCRSQRPRRVSSCRSSFAAPRSVPRRLLLAWVSRRCDRLATSMVSLVRTSSSSARRLGSEPRDLHFVAVLVEQMSRSVLAVLVQLAGQTQSSATTCSPPNALGYSAVMVCPFGLAVLTPASHDAALLALSRRRARGGR